MSRTCKSPRTVLVTAWVVAKAVLPAYSHRSSPKKFTQHQLFACLVLKAFLKTDYRGLMACLQDSADWCMGIELANMPHYTTFQKAARRLLCASPVAELLNETVAQIMGRKHRVPLAAIDSTGLESRHTSRYFIHRRSRTPNLYQTTQYTRYPKLGLLVDCSNHVVLGYLTDQGPKPDIRDLVPMLSQTSPHVRLQWLTADAGYDSESNHRHCREEHRIRTLIPPRHGRPTHKPASGRYRRLIQTRFDKKRYGQRWQVETVVSMMKRRLGSAVSGRSYWSRRRDLMLMVLTRNIMILLPLKLIQQIKVFYRAVLTHNIMKSAQAYCRRGQAYAASGDYFRAIQDTTQAIHLKPDLALAYFHRARAYLEEKNLDRALADLDEAVRLSDKGLNLNLNFRRFRAAQAARFR